MAGLFQPKRVQVPGLLSDEGLAVRVKELSQAAATTGQAIVPTSAVDFADKVTQLGQHMPGPQLKPAAPKKPQGLVAEQDARSTAIGDALSGAARQATVLPGPPGDIARAEQRLQTLGTISDPTEQAAEKQRQIDDARRHEETAKAQIAADERLRAMTDEEFTAATGLSPLARSFAMTNEQAAQDNAATLLKAQERTKAAEQGPLPTQTWWLNAAQVAARSAAQMGVGALKYPVDVWELTAGRALNGGDIRNSEVGVWLDGVDKAITKMLPGDPSRSKEFLTDLAAGAGSMGGFMVAGFAGRAVGVPAGIMSGLLGAAVEGNQLYEEAEDFNAVGLQKYLALILGSGLGMTEAIPLDRAFMRADAATGGLVRKLLQNTTATSLEEFLQEFGQSAGEDLVAKYGAGYDPDRELDPGSWLRQGAVGAITGAGAGVVTSVVGETAPQPVENIDETKLTQAVDDALKASQQQFDTIYSAEEAAVREPGTEGEVQASAGATAPAAKAEVARPDPVKGDIVQQIVEPVRQAQQVAQVEQQIAEQRKAQIESPEFKRFFEGSKVVDQNGAPKVVFHGTNSEFSSFTPSLDGTLGPGVYFATAANEAEMFGDAVVPAYVALQNPWEIALNAESPGAIAEDFDNPAVEAVLSLPNGRALLDAAKQSGGFGYDSSLQNELKKLGHDGIVGTYPDGSQEIVAFEPTQIKSAIANSGAFDPTNPNIDQQVAQPITREQNIDPVVLSPSDTAPLPKLEKGLHGPIPLVVKAAKAYAAAAGIPHRRQREYVAVDVARAARIAQAYADMKHEPQDTAVQAAYKAMAEETLAQYQFVKATGLKIDAMQEGQADPYPNGPRDVLRDIASGHIWYYPTKFGFGSDATFDPSTNPLLEPTSEVSDNGEPMLVNDVFRVVHDFFGHGLEGSGFGPRGEENAWQSHMRLYSASAVPAMTSETRGQNSWVNYGPHGEHNRANPRDTIYADQKSGIMPSWTWEQGVVDSVAEDLDAPVDLAKAPDLSALGYTVDNPATAWGATDWLTRKQEAAEASYSRLKGITGATTAYFKKPLWLKTSEVAQLPGARGERRSEGEPQFDALTETVDKEGWQQHKSPILIEVNHRGEAFIVEGNTRTAIAKRRNIGAVYAEVRWLNGGELIDGPWSPSNVARRVDSSASFHAAFAAAKEASPYGAVAHLYSPAKYATMKLFLTPDGLSGFALDGEDIVSVFSHNNAPRGRLRKLIDTALANGGRTLDAFDTGLPRMYAALGFREVKRAPFERKYAPKDWPYDKLGEPDVVFMEYGPDIERMEQREDALTRWHKDAHEVFKNEDGSPKVFYHGSGQGGFRVFNTDPSNGKTDGTGAWFTDDRRQARTYSGKDADIVINEDAETVVAALEKTGSYTAADKSTWTLVKHGDKNQLKFDFALNDRDEWFELRHEYKDGTGYTEELGSIWEVQEYIEDALNEASEQAGVYSVYLNAKNPAIVDWGEANWSEGPMETVWVFTDPANGDPYGAPAGGPFYDEDEASAEADAFLDRLKEENPGEYDDLTWEDIVEERQQPGYQTTDEFVRDIKENWGGEHDAVVLLNVSGSGPHSYGNATSNEIVVFEPPQIKSTANIGTYSETDPDIMRMTGTATMRKPYSLEPTRPTKGIPLPKGETTDARQSDVRLTQISRNFVKALDITARAGRLVAKDRKVMGEYNRRSAVARLRTWGDLSTLVHEGGHALNDMHAQAIDDFTDRNRGALSKIAMSLYGGDLTKAPIGTVLREGFAEFFRVYTLTPPYARKHWVQLVTDFEATIDKADGKLRPALNSIADQFNAWLQLPSSQLVENMVVDGRRLQGIEAAIKELRDAGFKSWMQEHARRAVEWSINRYAPLNQLVADLLNAGEENRGTALDLKRADDPRVIARLARNAGSRAMVELTDGVIGYRSVQAGSRGLREAITTIHGLQPDQTPSTLDAQMMKRFDAYLVSRRALDEYRRYEAGEIDRPPTGAQKGDHIRHVKEMEKQHPAFVQAAEIVNEYGMALWHKRYEAGLMDKETYEEGLQRQFYAPLQRDVTDKQGSGGDSLRFGSSVLTKGPRFRGSDRDIISPMTTLMHMTFALERQIAENDAKKALAILADRAGQAGALVERIPANQLVGQTFSVAQVARRLVDDADLSATDAADLMTILEGSAEQGDVLTLYRSEQAGAQGENVLFFWEGGKIAAIRLTEQSLGADVVNLMNGIGRENMDFTMELLAGTSGVFRTAITKWPDFLIVNYIRDQMSAWVLNDVGFVPFVSGIKGMIDEVRQKGWAKSYNAAAGVMGGMNTAALHEARVDRDLKALRAKGYLPQVFGEMDGTLTGNLKGAIKGFGRLTELSETGTRLGLYRAAFQRGKRDGLSDYEASIESAYIATDYIDFGLNGSKMLTTRRIIPFLNAQLQGFYKMVRTLSGDEVAKRKGLKFALTAYFKSVKNLPLSRVEKQQLNAGRLAWVKMASLGLFSAVLHFLFQDDPDYQEAGEYLRTTGWVVPLGNGRIAWIPKPFELAMAANAVERGLEFASGDREAANRFMRGVAFSLSPPTSPPALQTATELSINKDFFTGRDIVPDYMQALEPSLQYDNYTSSLAKWLGRTFNMSPMMVDHALSGLGASAYRDMMTLLNAADPTRPAPDETDAPILRRFVRDVRRGSASAQDFWAQASTTTGALERARASYKRYVDAGNEIAANRYLATLGSDARAYAVLTTQFKAEEKRLNPFYRARQVTTVISAMRRELTSELGLGDTTVKDSNESFPMAAGLKGQVDEVLSELARREVRNTLIATGQQGWAGKETLPLDPTLDMLLAVSPEAYDEYQRRYAKAKIYNADMVYENWPEARERLNADREYAVLSDLVAVASAGL